MRIAFGLRAHSGWAALVALGEVGGELEVAERSRMELVRDEHAHWAKQPYHAALGLEPADARDVVQRGIASARELAQRIAGLGKALGPPWGRDQKAAALAAWVALRGGSRPV